MSVLLFLCFLSGVDARVYTVGLPSLETPKAELAKGCGVISTPGLTRLTFDMSDGTADYSGSPLTSTATHRCGAGSMQCPHCFVIAGSVTQPLQLFLRACHATIRVTSQSAQSSFSSCGYSKAVPPNMLPICKKCHDRSTLECQTCIDNRIRCFEDCDSLAESCVSSTPSPLCETCSLGAWDKPSTDQLPTEGGRQFYYLTDDRVYEYLFINNSTFALTVGSDVSARYRKWVDEDTGDSNTVAPGTGRTAICYRGRFYWQ